ncbi:uncharacterized protein PITG_21196 [Phytophthora infestans T30-4]|uniref:Uncharacterized protein n=1 Tax=Phytophthora infestans (strain T30-4) TaxID=403677 RepID=D0P3W6_PHYIT|nr:uncharacterized protein PITG_21196 [Phytophthora infestans T30-4]EEY62097.1 hypothetical protein PITG_21196 [Phytophthora infestans T30-4]|eukprot:XP_002895006.1 hypothetical protein PITG_21196 [Phytophthora infestans T30-4]
MMLSGVIIRNCSFSFSSACETRAIFRRSSTLMGVAACCCLLAVSTSTRVSMLLVVSSPPSSAMLLDTQMYPLVPRITSMPMPGSVAMCCFILFTNGAATATNWPFSSLP